MQYFTKLFQDEIIPFEPFYVDVQESKVYFGEEAIEKQKEWIFVNDNQFIKMIQKYWNILNGGIYYEKAIKIINELQKI